MSRTICLSVDAMGGDGGPRLTVSAALAFLDRQTDTCISLFGREGEIRKYLPESRLPSRLSIVHTDSVVDMDEKPGLALRNKQSSSMWLSLDALNGEADACVSGGNTGALMALGRHLVKPIAGIDRPAICKPIPTSALPGYLLDLGANLECSAKLLSQFGLMGAALARAEGRLHPRVALLNVGSEPTKGSDEILKAAELMRAHSQIDFYGFVEGDELYDGKVDVIVCDGFTGNVALKVSEGLTAFLFDSLKSYMRASLFNKCVALIVDPLLKEWRKQFNPANFNGAILLGLKKIVIKSHGGSSAEGYLQALLTAREQVLANTPDKIERGLK